MSSGRNDNVTFSRAELEALHDVIEAARCFWHKTDRGNELGITSLRVTNRLMWRLGSELTVTGEASERFGGVFHSVAGDIVERLLEIVEDLSRQYSNQHDPWFADTAIVSADIIQMLDGPQRSSFQASLRRLGLRLIVDSKSNDSIQLDRQNWGPGEPG